MTQAIQFCLTGLCLVIYIPVITNAIRHIQNGEIELHGRSLFRSTPRRYTGASVWAYSGGQALSAIILIVGGLSAFQRDDLLFFLLTIIVSWLVGLVGLQFADRLGYEEIEDPHAEAINMFNRIFSNPSGFWNVREQESSSDRDEKNQSVIITFGNIQPSNPKPADEDTDSPEESDE